MEFIEHFTKENRWLSNFEEAEVMFEGVMYPNNEAAYMAAKCENPADRVPFTRMTGKEARKAGQRVNLRPGWDDMRWVVMYQINKDKYTRHADLRAKLLATGDAKLIEGNWWHDNFWGDCSCERCATKLGMNNLGRILMKIRDEVKGEY